MLTMLLDAPSEQTQTQSIDPSELVEKHASYLFRFALFRIGDESVSQDLVQETLLAAIKNMTNFSYKSSERTWLTSILKNKIIDYFRRAKLEETFDFAGQHELAEEKYFQADGTWKSTCAPSVWKTNPAQVVENQEFWQVFHRCLSKLPKRTATAFVLREIDGLTSDEICEMLNITPNNLWVILHRARLELRHEMELNFFSINN